MRAQPSTMAAVVPQKPIMLSSRVDFRFMPKMEDTMAPMDAAKPAIDRVSSRRFTCTAILKVNNCSEAADNVLER